MGPLDPPERDLEAQANRAAEADLSPIPVSRLVTINDLARDYYARALPGSWAEKYLGDRFSVDPEAYADFAPGYAPRGWTHLVDHLRGCAFTDEEMLAAGLATRASTGRLIDRFRDRVVFPISHRGEVLGFVGRRHPQRTDEDRSGPKYLNTAQTVLFHKGAQLFGTVPGLLESGAATPVLVEGPMDAIAVTVGSGGTHIGLAPLGTSLTSEQATQLAGMGPEVLVATDADLAGALAAERAYWLLSQHNVKTRHVAMSAGDDPASLLTHRGATALEDALHSAEPLSEILLQERLLHLTGPAAAGEAATVLAAASPEDWRPGLARITDKTGERSEDVQALLATWVAAWNRAPDEIAQDRLAELSAVRDRLEDAEKQQPDWAAIARAIDPRLPVNGHSKVPGFGQVEVPTLCGVDH